LKATISKSVQVDCIPLCNAIARVFLEVVKPSSNPQYADFVTKGDIVFLANEGTDVAPVLYILGGRIATRYFSDANLMKTIMVRPFKVGDSFMVTFEGD